MKNKTKNILTLLVTIVLVILILEGVFRFVLGSNLKYSYTKDTLWELKPNQQGFTYPNNKVATINHAGFRGEELENKQKTIIILGDSFMFGYSIGDNDTIPHNLELLLKSTEVINAAVPGYSIEQMIALYNKKLKDTKHDIVILSFIKEDIYRQKESPDYSKKMFLRKLIRSSSLIAFLKPRFNVIRQIIFDKDDTKFENYLVEDKERILEFDKQLKENNKKLILFPYIYKKEDETFYNEIKEFATENNIKTTDNNFKVIEEYGGNKLDLKAEDSHPSEIQTKLMAGFLKKYV